MAGCAGDPDVVGDPPTPDDASVQSTAGEQHDATGTPAPGEMCPVSSAPGTVLARTARTTQPDGRELVTNAAGEVAFLTSVPAGIAKLDAALNELYTYPHGSAVALDAAGNAYVAGGFGAPADFGLGVVTPTGNVDTFLVVLSPSGEVTSVRDLEILCGDGVSDVAVAADGRIALSGTAMGTVVLESASGDVTFQSAASGELAFDAAGDLVIGGSFRGRLDLGGGTVLVAGASDDVDGFVAKLDVTGDVLFAATFGDAALPVEVGGFQQDVVVTAPTPQRVVDVAVGPTGDVAIVGTYELEMSLDGQTLRTGSLFPSGTQVGTFVARLDDAGAVAFGTDAGPVNAAAPAAAVALGAADHLAVSANEPGNAQPPFSYPTLTVRDADGAPSVQIGDGASGYGLGVAFDRCGNVLWASYQNDPSLLDPHSFLTLVAP